MLFSEIWAIISNMKDKEPIIKKYAFRFSAVMLAVLIAGLVLCAACFALTTWQFTGFLTGDVSSFYEWVKYALPIRAYGKRADSAIRFFKDPLRREKDFFGLSFERLEKAVPLLRRF